MVKQGKAIWLSENILPHQVYSLLDLVLGLPIYSSAITEALCIGKNVLIFDVLNLEHRLRDLLPLEHIAKNVDELVNKSLMLLESEENIKITPKVFNEIDPFQDDGGNERFGALVNLWLNAINEKGNAHSALKCVVHDYRKMFGKQSVLLSNEIKFLKK